MQTTKAPKLKTKRSKISYAKWGYVFIAPFFLAYALFHFAPQLLTIYNSFFKVTLPLLTPILVYTIITALIGGLQMFDVPQVLTNALGTPNRTSTTLVMYLNNYLKTSKNYGMSGAISVVIFVITGLLSLVVFKSLTKQEEN